MSACSRPFPAIHTKVPDYQAASFSPKRSLVLHNRPPQMLQYSNGYRGEQGVRSTFDSIYRAAIDLDCSKPHVASTFWVLRAQSLRTCRFDRHLRRRYSIIFPFSLLVSHRYGNAEARLLTVKIQTMIRRLPIRTIPR